MFNKIIVTIDKAEITNKLLDATIEIARNKQTQVTLVNVSHKVSQLSSCPVLIVH